MPSYRVTPHPVLGAEVRSLDLNSTISAKILKKLKKDVHKYKVLVVKSQGIICGERQIEITRLFGEIETAGFELHPKSPDRLILRVSNDETEGFREFGVKGFHIDGSFMPNPNAYSIYHIISVPLEGETWFVSLNEVYGGITEEQKAKWEHLWMVKKFNHIRGFRDKPGKVVHPLVYHHPVTGEKTLCIAQGKTSGFVWDLGSAEERQATRDETEQTLTEIDQAIHRDNHALIYKHKWESGDFIISDNLAVGHMAHYSTQLPTDQVGLRVMHRTIVRGKCRPSKNTGANKTGGSSCTTCAIS